MNDKIILVTGGFDPLHSGHIDYIKEARKLGRVVVGVNSDAWLTRKKGQPFMPFEERLNIISNLKDVMTAIGFDDSDGSAKDAITQVRKMFPKNTIVFANGGDRTKENIPEMDTNVVDVEFLFGVGGDNKKNSSSWILNNWKAPTESRVWGKFMNYYASEQAKVKRLIIEPGKSISMQHHTQRSEFWFIEGGTGTVYTLEDGKEITKGTLQQHDSIFIPTESWHRLENTGTGDLCVIEIQYGEKCTEDDIIRLSKL
jgi:cytidyltransferase-like protein